MCGIPMQPPEPTPDALRGRKLTFEQALAHIGGEENLLSERGKWQIHQNARQYLWKYRDKSTHCTACGRTFDGFRGTHGQFYACPACGARCEFRYEALGHRYVFDQFVLYEWRRSIIDPETITLTATWVQRDSSNGHTPHEAILWTKPTALYIFRPGRAVTVYKRDRRDGSPWTLTSGIHPEHTKTGTFGGCGIVVDGWTEAIDGTRIGRTYRLMQGNSNEWQGLELTAIANCARRPWLEYLGKCGQAELAATLMRMPSISKEIVPNQRARTPRELLGLTEGQWFEVRRDGVALTLSILGRLRLLTRLNIGPVKVADAVAVDRASVYRLELLLPMAGKYSETSIGYLISLLPDKLRRKIIRRCLREQDDMVEWNDYYRQLTRLREVDTVTVRKYAEDRRVFAPTADPSLLLPKDMKTMHQRMTDRENLLRDEEKARETEKWRGKFEAKLLPALRQKYTFEAEGLLLRPYESAREVLAEGRALSICIGSYAERYVRGNTVVCCLRRANEPDKPWRAVEFSTLTGDMVQDRGYKNDSRGIPEDDRALLKRFWAAFNREKKKGRRSA